MVRVYRIGKSSKPKGKAREFDLWPKMEGNEHEADKALKNAWLIYKKIQTPASLRSSQAGLLHLIKPNFKKITGKTHKKI